MPWRILWKAEALLLAMMVGCGAAQPGLRLGTEAERETVLYIPRATTVEPVDVAPKQVTESIRTMAREVHLSGAPRETVERLLQQEATLPGSAQVSMQAARSQGILLSEVSAVESVAVTAEGFSVALIPGTMAMTARGTRTNRTEKHHIATIANTKSTLRGGPWTPLFEDLFARAGMRLKDRQNIVPIQGHKGPHPQRYHQLALESLQSALGGCRTIVECRARLLPALDDLARQISTPGTELNRLVTLGK